MMAFGAGSKAAERIAAKALAARALAAGVSALAFMAVAAQPAAAQSQAAAPHAAAVNVSVPAGSLESGLLALGRQANLKLLYQTAIAAGKTTQGVSGTMSPQAAVGQLLAGSGLNYTFTAANVVSIQAPSAAATGAPDGAIALGMIDVNGESPWGAVAGFVAHVSETATKIDTPIIETPQSISVVTQDQITTQQPLNVGQATRYEAGVTVDMTGADPKGEDYIEVRGFAASQYLDGLRVAMGNFTGATYDPYMLQRIEILKGPSAALYGQSYPGGIVDLVSKRPTENAFNEVQVQGGSYGRISAAFDVGGPIDPDKHWLYRVTGIGFNSSTQVDYTNLSRVSIAPALTYQPDASTSLTFLSNFRFDPNAGFWNKLPALGTLLVNLAGQIPDSLFTGDLNFNKLASTQGSIGYAFEHKFDDVWTVRQNFRYQHVSWAFDSVQGDSLSGTTLVRDKFQDINSAGNVALDNQAQADFSLGPVRQKVLFGLDYQHTDIFEKDTDADAPSLDIFAPIYAQPLPAYTPADTYLVIRQKLDQLGLYAQDQLAFGGWRLNAGIRQDWAKSSTTNFLDNDSQQNQNDKATTWRAGLLYLFDNGVAPYASYSTSFVPTTGTDAYSNPFKPTTGQQYEAGVKYQPAGFNALFTASAFDLTEQNVLTSDPNNPNNSIQTGEERSRGVELQAKMSLTDNLNVTAAYTYLDARVTQANDGTQGFRIWAIPHNAASLWADYKFTTDPLAGFALGAGMRYVGSTTDQSNTLDIPPFTLFDAMVRYDFGAHTPSLKGLSLALNVTNLNDTKYIQQCVNGCYYGLRRTILATLKYDW